MPITLDHLGELERTHSCGELRASDAGREVVLMGWVAVRRDFGPLTFIDLRDRDGITQIVFDAEDAARAHARAKEVRGEYVVAVRGRVVLREEGQRNPKLSTGDVEVQAREILVLNEARTPPFQLDAPPEKLAAEDVRLKYRYLDLRRPFFQKVLRLRAGVVGEIHRYMDEHGFTQLDVEFSFATREQVYRLIEGLLVGVFRLVGAELQTPFLRLTYEEALRRYGSDKPDLRIDGMELEDLAPALEGTT